jgi:hypothetical protein
MPVNKQTTLGEKETKRLTNYLKILKRSGINSGNNE